MGTTSTIIDAIVDAVITDLQTATTLGLGSNPTVYERDEHPAAALNRGDIPCAYVIPIMEGGDIINTDLDDLPQTHDFPITVTAYYLGSNTTSYVLPTDLRTVRGYAYNFVDYYKTKTGGQRLTCKAYIKNYKLDVGYWISGGGQVVHFWIVKMQVTAMSY